MNFFNNDGNKEEESLLGAHSSAEPSVSGPKEKSAEDGGRNKGGVAEASANAGGGSGMAKAGGAGGGAKKGRFGLDKIIAIVAFAFAIIALILTILLHLLWWYWPWCVTAPALMLALTAVTISFAAPSHKDLTFFCASIAVILSIGVIAWCAADLTACHSFQGPYHKRYYSQDEGRLKSRLINHHLFKKPGRHLSYGLEAQAFWHSKGEFCKGQCYDWSFKKKMILAKLACRDKVEKWFIDKHLNTDSRSCEMTDPNLSASARSYNERDKYPIAFMNVDSYSDSPIYKTHALIQKRKKWRYSKGEEKILKKELNEFCEMFNVDEFIKKRDECDREMEKSFAARCTMEEKEVRVPGPPVNGEPGEAKIEVEYQTGFFFYINVTKERILGKKSCDEIVDQGTRLTIEEIEDQIRDQKEWGLKPSVENVEQFLEPDKYMFQYTSQYELIASGSARARIRGDDGRYRGFLGPDRFDKPENPDKFQEKYLEPDCQLTEAKERDNYP